MSIRKKIKGASLVEIMLAVSISIFIFFVIFKTMEALGLNIILENSRIAVADELDYRVKEYKLTGNFNISPDGTINFSKTEEINSEDNYKVIEFTATDSDTNISQNITLVE